MHIDKCFIYILQYNDALRVQNKQTSARNLKTQDLLRISMYTIFLLCTYTIAQLVLPIVNSKYYPDFFLFHYPHFLRTIYGKTTHEVMQIFTTYMNGKRQSSLNY